MANASNVPQLERSREHTARSSSGYLMLLILVAQLALAVWLVASTLYIRAWWSHALVSRPSRPRSCWWQAMS